MESRKDETKGRERKRKEKSDFQWWGKMPKAYREGEIEEKKKIFHVKMDEGN